MSSLHKMPQTARVQITANSDHTGASFETVQALGCTPGSWNASESGLFCERPHLMLAENFWA